MHQNRISKVVTCYTTPMQAVERRVGDIGLIKGGLAWKLSREGGVVNTVVVLGSSGVGLGV